jgi:hypothetical protein
MQGKGNPYTLLVGTQIRAATVEVPQNIKNRPTL